MERYVFLHVPFEYRQNFELLHNIFWYKTYLVKVNNMENVKFSKTIDNRIWENTKAQFVS